MTKKFNLKLPSMIAITLFGAAFTSHQAHAAENNQTNADAKNVVDDQHQLKGATQAKQQVTQSTQNISGVQAYHNPSEVKANTSSNVRTYDANLDNLHNSNSQSKAQNNTSVASSSNTNVNKATTNNNVATNNTTTSKISNAQASNATQANNAQQSNTTNSNNNTQTASQQKNQVASNQQNLSSNQNVTTQNSNASQSNKAATTQNSNVSQPNKTVATQNSNNNKQQSVATNVNQDTQKQAVANTNQNTQKQAVSKADTAAQAQPKAQTSTTSNSNNSVNKTQDSTQTTNVQKANTNSTVNAKNTTATQNNEQLKTQNDTTKTSKASAQNNTASPQTKQTNPTTSAQTQNKSNKNVTTYAQPTTGDSAVRSVGGKGGPATNVRAVKRYATTSSLPKYKPQVSSSINNYIRSHNFQAPRIEEDYTSYFPQYGYRNGVGKPEGIVVHDTANDNSTIEGEINYMKNNYQNAFVHAFVDGDRIIETAPTDYLSWGAGPQGNERYINVEIVHTHDYDSFARSMNNYADYAATQLQYYDLQPDSAEYDGQGTVWTHYAVSRYLGGSDHSDPHAYFQAHNYSYDELYDLINEKYLIKTGQVAPWGTTSSNTSNNNSGTNNNNSSKGNNSSNTAKNDKLTVKPTTGLAQINTDNSGVYTTVYDDKGKATDQVHNTLSVTKSAQLGSDKYYLLSDYNSGKTYGWVKQNETTYNTVKSPVKVNQSYTIKPGSTLFTVPWGNYNQKAGTVSKSNTAPFKATKSQQVGTATYLYGSVNGQNGWVSQYYLSPYSAPKANVMKVSDLKNTLGQVSTKSKGAYTTVYDKAAKANPELNGNTYRITKKANLNNQDFYLISDYNSGQLRGWVPSSDISVKTATPTKTDVTSYKLNKNANVYSTPWGSKNQIKTTTTKSNQELRSIDTVQIGKDKYLHGVVNNVWGWVNANDVVKPRINAKFAAAAKPATATKSATTQTVSGMAQVNAKNDGIRATVYDKNGKNAAKYANKTYKVTKERTIDDNTYVLLQNPTQNTPLGWFNVKDLNVQSLSNEQKVSGTYTVNKANNGLYSVAWGTPQQRLDNKNLANQTFKVSKAATIGNTTYYYGTVNGKTGWIAQNDLTANNTVDNAENYNDDLIIDSANSFYYDSPSSAKAYALKPYNEQPFHVTKRKVVNGKTWYYGKLSNGKYVWIKDTDLKKQLVKSSKSYQTLNQAVAKQQNAYGAKPQVQRNGYGWSNASASEIKNAMNPETLSKDNTLKYQFLRLDRPQNLSVASMNTLLKGKGVLENQGQAFSDAAKAAGINEIYLIAHALLETGNGQSQLAKGADVVNNKVTTKNANKYYNVFGIAAYDSNPIASAVNYAKNAGWNSVSKAIIGGAKFIGQDYIKAGQNTLYKMRWNPDHPGTHQYATDINWANLNAEILKSFYDKIKAVGKYFEITSYIK
ncbi:autolysin [Staphylococcus petrasii]|uniref:Bifunctional autolysin n=1 Tax=Staphylococcus petrasii TaxID=1276936 RepID=A0A380G0R4_9STAP|nr:glucosaminidase domain-containing protein [Staphylococcus petrasii]PNZ33600.1 mannosyl-glycoprotein endo-beta-N-acetylglucosamidase [Staphylococcus petrasii]TGE11766.1 mannosyl-glycoprotein endo-beta-N-acetylglucosamidase [Staphylococcus petrasii]TGE18530.1 mannosyl-glycoprotein endo-beta-N-acetylglucosamidase [Staphylococcus petrasii]SUM44575.1 autolysin [Staphylococcus petrasii]